MMLGLPTSGSAMVLAPGRGVAAALGRDFMAGRGSADGTGAASLGFRVVKGAARRVARGVVKVFMAGRGRVHGTSPLLPSFSVVRSLPAGAGVAQPLMAGWEGAFETGSLPLLFSEGGAGIGGGGEYHVPVLHDEVVAQMLPGAGRVLVDGTLGGGGHASSFLAAGARVIGIDRDPEALAHARERLSGFGERFLALEGNFADADHLLAEAGVGPVDGWLLDIGVSSRQLDAPERGFSFSREGPLDMRMGPGSPYRAAEIVNTWDEGELVRIFRDYGEEKAARKLARAIIGKRGDRPFETTRELAACIEAVSPRGGRIHPATRVFQAIRMAANDELGALERALEIAPRLLRPGGRLLVISFHSLEDRMVKRWMQRTTAEWLDRPEWPQPRANPEHWFRAVTRKPITASEAEKSRNPRSRSAKLRVVERLETPIQP